MRRILCAALVGLFMFTVACQKQISSTPGSSGPDTISGGGGDIRRIQQGIDPDLAKDTLWFITYTSSKKISKIEDSLYDIAITTKYDVSDRLIEVNSTSLHFARFTYDAGGLLTETEYSSFGVKQKYVIEYTAGVISRTSFHASSYDGDPYEYTGYETYTVSGGNITEVKKFSDRGALMSQIRFLYGNQPNPFKNLSLFNFHNQLGMDQIVNFYTYFNKNISAGAEIGQQTFNTNNTFSDKRLTKITSEAFYGPQGIYTYFFSY